jgi:hypothetical protein
MAAATPPKGIDVVGIDNGSHGCHCERHGICGHFVKAEDFLFCKWAVQKFDDAPESCVKVFKLAADFQGASSSLQRTRMVPRMEERDMMVYG